MLFVYQAEKDRVVKTFSKESATSRMKWNSRQDEEQLGSYKELSLVDPTKSSGTSTAASQQKTLQHRAPRLNNVPAGVLFSSLASSIASQDTSARSVVHVYNQSILYLTIRGVALKYLDTWTVTLSSLFGRLFGCCVLLVGVVVRCSSAW